MRGRFADAVLEALVADGSIDRAASVLASCADDADRDLFVRTGFRRVTLTNLDERIDEARVAPFAWERADAQALPFPDNSFDVGFVANGLHHCSSPHRALLELHRVARVAVIALEARDSALMRAAVRLGLSPRYELEAVAAHGLRAGGVDNTGVPNFVYRWTEAEFEKTIRAADPAHAPRFRFFHGVDLPFDRLEQRRSPAAKLVVRAAAPAVLGLARAVRRQGNLFAMVALKTGRAQPWIAEGEDGPALDARYAERL